MKILDDEWKKNIDEILIEISDAIALSPAKYKEAKDRYTAVGEYLNSEHSPLAIYKPKIFPQGSFAVGTAVRPLLEGDDHYDADSVCRLEIEKSSISQFELKKLVGDRLKEGRYKDLLETPDGRRCWTIQYAEGSRFHLDVLPSVQDPEWRKYISADVCEVWAREALCITDKKTWKLDGTNWPKSNPKGYTEWFKSRMAVTLNKSRFALARALNADVHDIPYYEVRTPLQRIIQLLKRHRDKWAGDDDYKPISIILTTLASRAYEGQDQLLDALLAVVPRMRHFIEVRLGGVNWVPNPVNPSENFADKWLTEPRKQERFFEWLNAIENFVHDLVSERAVDILEEFLFEAFGDRDVTIAFSRRADRLIKNASSYSRMGLAENMIPGLLTVSHRKRPVWPFLLVEKVKITCLHREKPRVGWKGFQTNGPALSKGRDLMFIASTSAKPPYNVYWQVVNTGQEALAVGKGRGDLFPAKSLGVGGLRHCEKTLYGGTHYIECFIVKDNTCIANSGEFLVNIA